jgi:uncharacterized protein YkwD
MKRRLISVVCILALSLFASCIPDRDGNDSSDPGANNGSANNGGSNNGGSNNGGGNNGTTGSCTPAESEACQVFELVNIERSQDGKEPLEYNSALGDAAQLHAEDMVENGYFSHTSQDGRSFADRTREAGYTGSPGGENIAAGQRSPEQVMNSWMNSDGHRRNILNGGFDEIGVGYHNNYWVQVFGRR